jgi:hypothetical protein
MDKAVTPAVGEIVFFIPGVVPQLYEFMITRFLHM